MRTRATIALLATVLLPPTAAAQADVIHVDDDAPPGGDGGSGNPRFVDDPDAPDPGQGGCPLVPLVEIGAYELPGGVTDCCPWDLDGDVGIADFLALLGNRGPCA